MEKCVSTMEDLKRQIDEHEIISFDIFDTLIMRKTLYPEDVFYITAEYARRKHIEILNFHDMRIRAILENRQPNPNLDEIYQQLQVITGISDTDKQTIKELEIYVESICCVKRNSMVELLQYAVDHEKAVYLITDMYLPKEIIIALLDGQNIKGYQDIYVSCEHRLLKNYGLFNLFKQEVKGSTYLHIGDNISSDGTAAKQAGIDSFLIKKASDLLTISAQKDLLNYAHTLNEKTLLGLYISRLFNDPFILENQSRCPVVSELYDIGYLFIAPLISSFMVWLIEKLQYSDYQGILFSARDGFLPLQLYKTAIKKLHLEDMPEGIYFETSRLVCAAASIKNEEDIKWLSGLPFSYSAEDMVRILFGLKSEQVFPYSETEDKDLTQYAMKHECLIYDSSNKIRENYLKYCQNQGMISKQKYGIFDLVSAGTCQSFLTKLLPYHLEGLYFCKVKIDDSDRKSLSIQGFFENEGVGTADSYMYSSYHLLEMIMTSFSPSLIGFGDTGNAIHAEEKRSIDELDDLKNVHRAIRDYFNDFMQLYVQKEKITPKMSDMLFKMQERLYTKMNCDIFGKSLLIDDWMQNKVSFRKDGNKVEDRKKIIADFLDLITREIEESVELDIPLGELTQYKNILIIRSTKNTILHEFIEDILKIKDDIRLNIFGNGIDRQYLNTLKETNKNFYCSTYAYDGRFDVGRMPEYKAQFAALNIDAIVFTNYEPHEERYLNIEQVALCLSEEDKIPVYAYMDGGSICRYTNLDEHIRATSLYVSLVRWFHI